MKRNKPKSQGQPLPPGIAIETYRQPDGSFTWRIIELAELGRSRSPVASEEVALEQAQVALAALSFAMNVIHGLNVKARLAARQAVESN